MIKPNKQIEPLSEKTIRISEVWGSLIGTSYYEIPETSILHGINLQDLMNDQDFQFSSDEFLRKKGAYLQNITQDGKIVPAIR